MRLLLVLISFSFLNLATASVTDKLVDLNVDLPSLYGKGFKAHINVEYDENFSRVKDFETYFKVENFIYITPSAKPLPLDPSLGGGVVVSKEKMKDYIDTDLLRVEFSAPFYNKANNMDNYPTSLKFRSSLLRKVFKRVKVNILRPARAGEKWKVFYGNIAIDVLAIKVNAIGSVSRIVLSHKGKEVKEVDVDDLETIAQTVFEK